MTPLFSRVHDFVVSLFFSSKRRASADVWWVIIGAVIALIVLVVLLVSFTGRNAAISTELASCEGKGGVCFNSATITCPQGTLKTTAFSCPQQGICCLGSPKTCVNQEQCESKKCIEALDQKRYCE